MSKDKITKRDLNKLKHACDVMCEFCTGGICECCPDKETLRHWEEKYNEQRESDRK